MPRGTFVSPDEAEPQGTTPSEEAVARSRFADNPAIGAGQKLSFRIVLFAVIALFIAFNLLLSHFFEPSAVGTQHVVQQRGNEPQAKGTASANASPAPAKPVTVPLNPEDLYFLLKKE